MKKSIQLLAMLAAGTLATTQAAAPAAKCASPDNCVETRAFVATVTGFRTSKQGSSRVVTATVHFVNKTAKPLTIGYVTESGVALDDLGNRYVIAGANAVRAIGEVAGVNFDPKFTLPPNEGGDARFELTWKPEGKAKAGNQFELDLAIREIAATGADQFKLGGEHALHFASLAQAAAGAVVGGAPTPVAKPAQTAENLCASSPRCYNAGAFIAEVLQVQSSAMIKGVRHQSVTLNIRFRNISDRPLILAYRASSSAALDNFGNGFTWGRPGTYDTSVKGIGLVSARSADTQFQLSPGQSRSATFGIVRYNAVPPIGDRWNYDVVIEEVEIQPGQVVKSVRQNSLTFAGLAAGNFPAAGGGATTAAAAALGAGDVPADGHEAVNKLIDLIDRKTQKKK